MKIDIHTDGVELDEKLQQFTLCCAGFELGNFSHRSASVQIRLASLEESSSRRDRFCQVRVVFFSRHDVVVEALDADLHIAIHWALERAGWNVANRMQIERRRLERDLIAAQTLSAQGEPDQAA
ncbi:MAG: hypothetical protein QNJ16_22140 [Rhodobacter sp.]|nr:hypothetical protein [Rhodobacter sp.]